MIKLLIVSDSLRVGGIQRALENLLNIIDYNKYDITLFLFNNSSDYKHRINKNVKIINGNRLLKIANMTSKEARQKSLLYFIIRKIIAILCAVLGANIVYKIMFMFEKKKVGYHCVISFSNNINNRSVYFGVNKFVLEKTEAKRKVSWLHVDYKKMNMTNKLNRKEYERFDTIVHVSEAVKKTFLSFYPEMEEKCKVVYNIIPTDKIKMLSKEFKVKKKSRFSLVSVGRLDKNKSPKSYVYVARCLKEHKIDFHWWIIGDGPEKSELLAEIQGNNLLGYFTLLGEVNNPYPYIKYADLFVSASKSESFGLAIAEALCLGTPVVARNYPALEELITHKKNGIISYDNSDESLADSVLEILNNPELYEFIRDNSNFLISQKEVYQQFDNVIEIRGLKE